MKDSRMIINQALRGLDEALHCYESGEDTLTVAKRLLRRHRMLAKARSALIREQVETIFAKPTLARKDEETLEELLRSSKWNYLGLVDG